MANKYQCLLCGKILRGRGVLAHLQLKHGINSDTINYMDRETISEKGYFITVSDYVKGDKVVAKWIGRYKEGG